MEDVVAESFANRGAAIPVLNIPADAFEDGESPSDRRKNATSDHATAVSPSHQTQASSEPPRHKRHVSLQDRVFTKLLEQIIPPQADDGLDQNAFSDGSSTPHLERPGFSLPMMTNNFRRFNARIGVVFVFQARAIRLFSWRTPSHTLSFLAVYSFICVYPFLLPAVPLCLILLFVMVPAYLARHPPPPTDTGAGSYLSGPALAPPRVVKPAPELSHDFFRNMRDLQNSMSDFATLHDVVLRILTPWTNFADEAKSSAAFLSITVTFIVLILIAPILPWRAMAFIGGWAMIGSNHPRVQSWLKPLDAQKGAPARQAAGNSVQRWIREDFTLDEPPEILEVEIFELQRRQMPSSLINPSNNFSFQSPTSTSTFATHAAPESEYEGWMFSPTAWEPQAPARRAGDRPKGARFFEDVQPPEGWVWASKKWILDLGEEGAGEDWVGARMLRGLEVEREGERWVYDLVDGDDLGDIYDEYRSGVKRPKTPTSTKPAPRSTEPSEASFEKENAVVFRGEWRRRRWVRSVKRAKVYGSGVKIVSDVSGGSARGGSGGLSAEARG